MASGAISGCVLAGGAGRRLGQDKAGARVGGAAMILRPLGALEAVCSSRAVVCKEDTVLPPLPAGVQRWHEPAEPRHPAAGIVAALAHADTVLVVAADMPFVTAEDLSAVLTADDGIAAATVARDGSRLQPLLGLYRSTAIPYLARSLPDGALTMAVERLGPLTVALAPERLESVNTPAQLAAAQARLAGSLG